MLYRADTHRPARAEEPINPGHGDWRSRDLQPCDRPLDHEHEPALGAHMLSPRRGYVHHGIYVGSGRVIQYGGLSWGLRRGPVEEVPLAEFANGRRVWVRAAGSYWFDQHEVVRRARSRLGEDRYSLLTNNCEHFCEWCVRGQHRSYQVDERSTGYRGILLRLIEFLVRARLPLVRRVRAEGEGDASECGRSGVIACGCNGCVNVRAPAAQCCASES